MGLQATPTLHHHTAIDSLSEIEVNDLRPAGCLLASSWMQRLLRMFTGEVSDRKSEVVVKLVVELQLEL